jgi:hypothetical protein
MRSDLFDAQWFWPIAMRKTLWCVRKHPKKDEETPVEKWLGFALRWRLR